MQHLAAGELVNLALWNASDVVIRRISGLIHSPNRNTSNNMKKKENCVNSEILLNAVLYARTVLRSVGF